MLGGCFFCLGGGLSVFCSKEKCLICFFWGAGGRFFWGGWGCRLLMTVVVSHSGCGSNLPCALGHPLKDAPEVLTAIRPYRTMVLENSIYYRINNFTYWTIDGKKI